MLLECTAAATSATGALKRNKCCLSATAAQTAQAAAELFDNFDDRSLGTFTSDPTVDNVVMLL